MKKWPPARLREQTIEPDFEEQGEIDRDPLYVFRLYARDHVRSDPTQSGTRNEIAIVYPYPYQRRDVVYTVRGQRYPHFYSVRTRRELQRNSRMCVHTRFIRSCVLACVDIFLRHRSTTPCVRPMTWSRSLSYIDSRMPETFQITRGTERTKGTDERRGEMTDADGTPRILSVLVSPFPASRKFKFCIALRIAHARAVYCSPSDNATLLSAVPFISSTFFPAIMSTTRFSWRIVRGTLERNYYSARVRDMHLRLWKRERKKVRYCFYLSSP